MVRGCFPVTVFISPSHSTPHTNHMMNQEALPLAGIRVLDLSRVLAGPYCAMLLSMMGAEVIKIEDASGDESRAWPPMNADLSGSFLGMNLNKRGIVINLKEPEGAELVKAMAANSDVLVENFKTGTMERFGLDYQALRGVNPRLVYTSISAFGREGPRASDPGYEALMQAFTGVMEITGFPDGDPARCGVSFLDMATGINSALATVSALYQRERTGEGCRVDASLLQTALGLMTSQVSNFYQHGSLQKRIGTAHPSVVPYQAFPTADGSIFVAAANQNLWERMCRGLGTTHLLQDARFGSNPERVKHREVLLAELKAAFGAKPTDELMRALKAEGVPCAPVNTLDKVLGDGQVEAIRAVASVDDPVYGRLSFANLPFHFNGKPGQVTARAPLLGEHTRTLLEQMGMAPDDIQSYLERGIVHGK